MGKPRLSSLTARLAYWYGNVAAAGTGRLVFRYIVYHIRVPQLQYSGLGLSSCIPKEYALRCCISPLAQTQP
jgi:hypothetical protein